MKIIGIGNAIVDVICKVEDKYLLDNNLLNSDPNINDPYYDEWVKFELERKAEKQKEEKLKEAKEVMKELKNKV